MEHAMKNENQLTGRSLYTEAEKIARRKACKQASDARCKARKDANTIARRARLIAAGLNAQGKPRKLRNQGQAEQRRQIAVDASKQTMRGLMKDICGQRVVRNTSTVAYSATGDLMADYMAGGGFVEVLAARWVPPTRYPAPGFGFSA